MSKSKDTLEVNSKLEESSQSQDNLQRSDATSEENLRRSVRQRQPPTRYGVDEYADMAKENLVHITLLTMYVRFQSRKALKKP